MKSDIQVGSLRNAYFTRAAIVAMLLVFAGFARTYPQWSGQNRPYVVTSKPAIWPGT